MTAVLTSVHQQTETREPSIWRPAATSGAGWRQQRQPPAPAREEKVNITTTRRREFVNVNPFLSTHSYIYICTYLYILYTHVYKSIYIHIYPHMRREQSTKPDTRVIWFIIIFLFWYISWHLEICNKHFLRKRVGLCGDGICIKVILNISRELT